MARRLFAAVLIAAWVSGSVSAAAHDRFRFTGTVVKMDTAAKLLKLKTSNPSPTMPAEVEIDIVAKTRVEQNGRKVTVAALKPGVYVVVDAMGDDVVGTEASLIRLVPAPKKSSSPDPHRQP